MGTLLLSYTCALSQFCIVLPLLGCVDGSFNATMRSNETPLGEPLCLVVPIPPVYSRMCSMYWVPSYDKAARDSQRSCSRQTEQRAASRNSEAEICTQPKQKTPLRLAVLVDIPTHIDLAPRRAKQWLRSLWVRDRSPVMRCTVYKGRLISPQSHHAGILATLDCISSRPDISLLYHITSDMDAPAPQSVFSYLFTPSGFVLPSMPVQSLATSSHNANALPSADAITTQAPLTGSTARVPTWLDAWITLNVS